MRKKIGDMFKVLSDVTYYSTQLYHESEKQPNWGEHSLSKGTILEFKSPSEGGVNPTERYYVLNKNKKRTGYIFAFEVYNRSLHNVVSLDYKLEIIITDDSDIDKTKVKKLYEKLLASHDSLDNPQFKISDDPDHYYAGLYGDACLLKNKVSAVDVLYCKTVYFRKGEYTLISYDKNHKEHLCLNYNNKKVDFEDTISVKVESFVGVSSSCNNRLSGFMKYEHYLKYPIMACHYEIRPVGVYDYSKLVICYHNGKYNSEKYGFITKEIIIKDFELAEEFCRILCKFKWIEIEGIDIFGYTGLNELFFKYALEENQITKDEFDFLKINAIEEGSAFNSFVVTSIVYNSFYGTTYEVGFYEAFIYKYNNYKEEISCKKYAKW
jgi:hypothetical protein